MALPAFLKKIMGSESKKNEAAEKKLPAKTYAQIEKAEGAKSTSAKKPMRSAAAPAKKMAVKKTVAKKK
jgi:hypothetical protein